MAAVVVAAIDQEPASASGAHFSEGDFLAGQFGRALFERDRSGETIAYGRIRERERRGETSTRAHERAVNKSTESPRVELCISRFVPY
jgi:hypothetical protein